MKILLFGGFGFCGLHTMVRLARDHEIIVIDPHVRTAEEHAFLSKRSFTHLSTVMAPTFFCKGRELHDVDVVVSLPGRLGSVPSVGNLADNLRYSVLPHLALLDMLKDNGLTPLVVFPSSDLTYCSPPRCMYTANKLYVEDALRIAHRIYGIPYVVLRMATGYGPMQRRDSVVNFYVRRGLEGGEIPVWGDGLNRQAFIYADDMARAFEMACEGKFPVGVYPLVGHNTPIGMIAWAVSRLVGGKVVLEPYPELAEKVSVGDLPVTGNPPGFSPRISLEEGIGRTAEWMKGEGIEKFNEQ